MRRTAYKLWWAIIAVAIVAPIQAYAPLKGVKVSPVRDPSATIDIGDWLKDGGYNNNAYSSNSNKNMVVFGTYAADFNAIEYGQRLRYYWPRLQEMGVSKCAFLLNCQPSAAEELARQIALPSTIEMWFDNRGDAGRAFGVQRGWLPDNDRVSPFVKLFGMLWGLGAWATLPAVISGYIGNPFAAQPWIEDALTVGTRKGRWPNNALEVTPGGRVKNKFSELPLVGSWKRRPLELATLRLQNMLGISLANWKQMAPDEEGLQAGVLTQLGGCLIVDSAAYDRAFYEWKDPGICAVANFEDILKKLK